MVLGRALCQKLFCRHTSQAIKGRLLLRTRYTLPVPKTLHIIYASTSGHTEYVVHRIADVVTKKSDTKVEVQLCDMAQPEDIQRGDVLLLASGTWNTGGVEGQLNPHMYTYLKKTVKTADLLQKPIGIIALGDDRYFYTCRAGEHLRNYIQSHNGKVLGDTLCIVNEPYDQDERIEKWTDKLCTWIAEL